MKYTFLLPAFKGRFLDEMLRSIQGQTYRDFKVIISDDCSPEDLRSICEPYLADPRFTYRRNAENMGSKSLVSHWNMLVDMCDTEFLIMASDDDVYSSIFLEEIDQLTINYPEVNLFRARMEIIDESGNLMVREPVFQSFFDRSHFFYQYYTSNMLTCEANYIYKALELKQKGGYVEFPLAWYTDDATHLMMAEKGCAISSDVLFSYRDSQLSISNKWGIESDSVYKIEASLNFWKWINEYVKQISEENESQLISITAKKCKDKICNNITTFMQFLKMNHFLHYITPCTKELGMSKIVLSYYWIRIYLRNRLRWRQIL